MTEKLGLIILDGWGIGNQTESDAVFQAHTPFMDKLMSKYPSSTLLTDGENVGLPIGQMGNSEVGHLNIGAGRIVYQELTRINKSIENGEFFQIEKLKEAFSKAKNHGSDLHLMGLVSDGGVHSSKDHLFALCKLANELKVEKTFIHAFTDGRDCDPKSGLGFIEELTSRINGTNVKIASVIGRYYSMDRDNRWERIKKAYDLMVRGIGAKTNSAINAIEDSYKNEITDEFIEPIVVVENDLPIGKIKAGDVVICFNFRTDRPREISIALTQKDVVEFDMKALNISYYTMTNYDKTFRNVFPIFEKENLLNTLGEVLSKKGLKQLRIAETEKYPHVTFFFSGGRELEFENERRIMINSPKVATYDLQPEMSALDVKTKVIEDMKANAPNFICLNFANPDMVGHTGVFPAIIRAVETVDSCLNEVVEDGLAKGYEFIIIADHGNADFAINEDGSPNTAHSLNPVPIILVSEEVTKITNGILADVAPTILKRFGIERPLEMSGKSLC